jgi:hypothetical protein
VGFAHSNVNKPRPDDQFVCVLTGKVCSNRELYEVGSNRPHGSDSASLSVQGIAVCHNRWLLAAMQHMS